MAKLNWDRVRTEQNGRRYGYEKATDVVAPPLPKKKRKKKKKGQEGKSTPPPIVVVSIEDRIRKVHEAQELRKAKAADKASRMAAHQAQIRAKRLAKMLDARSKLASRGPRKAKVRRPGWMETVVVVQRRDGEESEVRKGLVTESCLSAQSITSMKK